MNIDDGCNFRRDRLAAVMSMRMERLYLRFFNALPIHSVAADEDLHLLNADELRQIRRTEFWALCAAVLVEVIAYLVIFLPIYEFPDFFEARGWSLGGPFFWVSAPVLLVRDAWMLVATLAELYVLLLVNLAAVHGIAVATGYIRRETRSTHAPGLIQIALEKHSNRQQEFGIDPFEGMRPWVLYLFLLINRLKGLIGNALIRAAVTNLFGREILRVVLDFSGMPLYMAINLYTTHAILRNARVVVMGQTSIELLHRKFPRLSLDSREQGLIYDALQYIAVHKRDFHPNHYFLTRAVIEHFGIPVQPQHPLPADFLEKLTAARAPVADLCRMIIVLGFMLDGRLSWRERRQLGRLQTSGILDLHYRDLEEYRRDFVDGQGLAELAHRYLSKSAQTAPAAAERSR